MSDFLNFLNTADLDTLTKIPGISRPLAGNIIAARPFDFVEDALRVKGMGKNLLGRMQSHFEAGMNESESRAMVTVEEEAAPIEKSQPRVESPAEEKPSFWASLGRAFVNILRAIVRFILTLTLIVGVGAALYFGLPYLNQKFVVPVEQNAARIDQLSSEIAALNEKITSLQTEVDAANGRVDTLEKTIEAHTALLAQLEEMQSKLEAGIKNGNDTLALEVKREVMLTRTIEFLSRARLYLSQSNFGLAREDVQSARDLLAQLQGEAPEYQADALSQVIARLDLALGNLPAFPVIAVDDLDIAWQMLMNGLPESAAEAVATPTIQFTPTFTSTPSPEPASSGTPTP